MYDRNLNSQKNTKDDKSPDISSLIATLNYFHPISEGVKNFFKEHCFSCTFNKGKLLLKAGEVCDDIYFIKKGVVRGYIKEGNKDITTWITADNELVSSISNIGSKDPSQENMQAIEDCEMLAVNYIDLEHLYVQFP